MTAEEARKLIEGLKKHRLRAPFPLAIYTGMRQGELLALRWCDVGLKGGTIAVRHTLTRTTHELAEPKTKRSRRLIYLADAAVAALRAHRDSAPIQLDQETYVFRSAAGTPLDSRNLTQDHLQTVPERLKLPKQRFHDLRHAYATLMIEAGEELAVVSRALGHSNLSSTADVYPHPTPVIQKRAASRVDAILGGAKAASSG